METRTSATHPIIVNWAAGPEGRRVGLTFAPGKQSASTLTPVVWARDLSEDLDRIRSFYGATVLSCLVEDHELHDLRIPELVAEGAARGLEVRRLPIVDGSVPDDLPALYDHVEGLAATVLAGGTVVVHCKGGLGRTGLVGACLLVELGLSPADALSAVVAARGPSCPERESQRALVRSYRPRRGP